MSTSVIRYRFRPPSGDETRFDLCLDNRTAELQKPVLTDPPEWAKLAFRQCPNCPLSADEHPLCPVAHSLVDVVPRFEELMSFNRLTVRVETEARTISAVTDVQAALSSMVGLIMASSGCPRTVFFRPMARYHLPLADEGETIHRAVSNWLLVQHFRRARGGKGEQTLDGLVDVYEQLQVVNAALTSRLRAAGRTDSTLNAVVLLDLFALIVPAAVEESLGEVRALLEPFLESSV